MASGVSAVGSHLLDCGARNRLCAGGTGEGFLADDARPGRLAELRA